MLNRYTNLRQVNWLEKLEQCLLFLVIGGLFLFAVSDADLGWHLKYGEHFFKTGHILWQNIFSYAMPNFAWVNHSWGYDILLYPLFIYGGFTAVSLVSALLVALSFFLVFTPQQRMRFGIPAVLVFSLFSMALLNSGLRSQVISFFLTVVLWKLLELYRTHHKTYILCFFPLVFFAWANLHGQFIVGLGLMGLYIAGLTYKSKLPKIEKRNLWLTVIASGLATFVNPYGTQLHISTFEHFTSPVVENIIEWQPWPLMSPLMILLLLYSAHLWYLIYRKKNLGKQSIFLLVALNAMAIKSRRVIPLFVLLSLPVYFDFLWAWFATRKNLNFMPAVRLVVLAVILVFLGSVVIPGRNVFAQNWETYCSSEIQCSEGLIAFLKENNIRGKIFNAYRLGGHLIYRYPEEKVFIDGRMTLWKDNQGRFPFQHYSNIIYAKADTRQFFYNQRFEYVIINQQYSLAKVLREYEKWPVIYEDERVVMFKNPHETKS